MIQPQNFPRKSRIGCLGMLALLAVVVPVFLLVFEALATPYGFYLGGHFHLIPMWQGMGTAHAANGRDYIIFISIYPNASNPGRYDSSLTGNGFLCTPKREKFRMRVG